MDRALSVVGLALELDRLMRGRQERIHLLARAAASQLDAQLYRPQVLARGREHEPRDPPNLGTDGSSGLPRREEGRIERGLLHAVGDVVRCLDELEHRIKVG